MNNEELKITEEYEKEAAFLLQRIKDRDELVGLLKIARPEKIPLIQKTIAAFDDVIEQTENILELQQKKSDFEEKIEREDEKTFAMMKLIEKELIEHVAKNNPEKLPELMEMLTGKKSH